MPEFWFYHLTVQPFDVALKRLLEMCRMRDWRVLVQTSSEAASIDLDASLWEGGDLSFLPHARFGDPRLSSYASMQPIWVTHSEDHPNAARVLFLLDDSMRPDLDDFERCIYLFDGHDADAVSRARARWQALTERALTLVYWQQDTRGAWVKKNHPEQNSDQGD